MRRAGRALDGVLFPLILCARLSFVGTVDYGVPVEIKLWNTGRTPLAHMVDITNGFGLRVLAEHNFLNDNNIAFSPYGLMGIMAALYEGVDGESSYQIQRGMQLPWNRNVMRIGFRDIHRTLKTYFVPEEGFLAGLALNNENVTFNDSYKRILRFYGFDLENDQLPTLPPSNGTENGTTMATGGSGPAVAADSEATTPMSESKPTEASSVMREDVTPNPNAETIDVDVRAPTEATTANPSLAPNAESTTTAPDTTTQSPVTEAVTQTTTAVVTETTAQTTTEAIQTTTIVPTTPMDTPAITNPPTDAMSTAADSGTSGDADAETIGQQTSQATSALTQEPTSNNELSTTIDMGSSSQESSSVPTMTTSMNDMTESLMTTMSDSPTDGSTTLNDMTTLSGLTTTANDTIETLQRRKRSIVDFIFTNPPYIDDYFMYRSYHIGPDMPSPGFDDKMFLANGLKSVQVTYMHYETVLEHAYLPHLEASALRLPLDSERYYLLVVLPNRGGAPELGRLIARMARESDLADVYAALRPRRVRAVVPSFIVKGHVTLTTDLQKLGIRDVFEPRQRDFTPMTPQGGVYVRSIEQAVSVAIRKYRPDEHKKNRYVNNREPVVFSATYPFLYFVMDASIHVALMAGKMVDPLNSRIL